MLFTTLSRKAQIYFEIQENICAGSGETLVSFSWNHILNQDRVLGSHEMMYSLCFLFQSDCTRKSLPLHQQKGWDRLQQLLVLITDFPKALSSGTPLLSLLAVKNINTMHCISVRGPFTLGSAYTLLPHITCNCSTSFHRTPNCFAIAHLCNDRFRFLAFSANCITESGNHKIVWAGRDL